MEQASRHAAICRSFGGALVLPESWSIDRMQVGRQLESVGAGYR
jgi:hypothetical protein